jgi:hypothetical protein
MFANVATIAAVFAALAPRRRRAIHREAAVENWQLPLRTKPT